jgi:hypothetical protein
MQEQLAQRVADLERDNQQLRDQLVDCEGRRTAAEARVKFLEETITHLAGLTPRIRVVHYELMVEEESGRRVMWTSRDAARKKSTPR